MEVLCAGELLWDCHVPRGERLETAVTFRRVPGGAAFNVARVLVDRGIAAGVAGVVSEDAMGRGLERAIEAAGVDTAGLRVAPGRTGVLFVDAGGVVAYRPERDAHPPIALDGSVRLVHVAALDPAPDVLDALGALTRRARERGTRVVVDVNARPRAWRGRTLDAAFRAVLGQADLVKASVDDLEQLGVGPRGAAALREPLGARPDATIVRSDGPRRLEAAGPWGTVQVDPEGRDVAVELGAGDAFCAGVIAALRGRWPIDRRGWRAAIEAGLACAAEHLAS